MLTPFRRRAFLFVISLAATAAGPLRPAWAWGPHGHRIATRVAEARLTPAARKAVHELLHEGDTLVEVSNLVGEYEVEIEAEAVVDSVTLP